MNNITAITLIVLGATGDLTKRKLIPAVYNLIAEKKLTRFALVGAALTDATIDEVLDGARSYIKDLDENIWKKLRESSYYQPLDFSSADDFDTLHTRVQEIEKEKGLPGKRIVYLAAAAHFFCPITGQLARSGLVKKDTKDPDQWHRIAYEKPFGHDAKSAHEINMCIGGSFNEEQIFRIDHYLMKELVSNIALVRFTNCVFEPLWNSKYIDHVQIVLNETVDVQGRGAYYDNYGALADVVQNHILELLALIAMESPPLLSGDHIRAERTRVLEKVRVIDGVLGQYRGYSQEKDVAPDSTTETFAALYLTVENPRWAGVPFYIKTGKALKQRETAIHIKFKQVDCLLAHRCPNEANWLTMHIAPETNFSLALNVKKPGAMNQVVSIPMTFSHSTLLGPRSPEAYEVLLEEIMRGEQAISVRFDEIEAAWKVIDDARTKNFSLFKYDKNSDGPPEEIEHFKHKYGMEWRS